MARLFLGSRAARGAQRRRVLLGAAVLLIVGAGAVPALGAAPPAAPAPLDRNLDHYALLALDSLHLKGKNAGQGGVVQAGYHIGVNNPRGVLEMCGGGSGHEVNAPQSQVVADYAVLTSQCHIGDLYIGGTGASHLSGKPAADYHALGNWNFGTPGAGANPVIPASAFPDSQWSSHACAPKAKRAIVSNVIVPGSYYELRLDASGNANIGPGDYVFCEVSIERSAKQNAGRLTVSPGAWIWVTKDLNVGAGSIVGIDGGANGNTPGSTLGVQWFVGGQGVKANGSSVAFGRGAQFYGRIWAPTSSINLGNTTNLGGRFWAKNITSDWAVTIKNPTTTTSTTTASSASTSTTTAVSTVPPTTEPPTTEPPPTEPPTPTTEPETTTTGFIILG